MKIILRQFLVVNPDNNEEQRTKLTFAQLHKKFNSMQREEPYLA